MASDAAIRAAVSAYVVGWNDHDLDRWLGAFAECPRIEYPAGGSVATSRDRLVAGWTQFNVDQRFVFDPLLVISGGDEVALHLRWDDLAGGPPVESISVLTIGDTGRIESDRAFYQSGHEYPALARHFELFTRGHDEPRLKEEWLRLFTPDCFTEEPVGSDRHFGVMAQGWEMAHRADRRVRLTPLVAFSSASPTEAASVMKVSVSVGDRIIEIPAIGIWCFAADGRISGSRIFQQSGRLGPEVWSRLDESG